MQPPTKTQLIVTAIFIVIILSSGIFIGRCTKSTTDFTNTKELLNAKDTIIKKENEKIGLYERMIEEKERTYERLNERDSILDQHYKERELTYKKLNETLSTIPARINRISQFGDSIRAAFREF